jgi:hypothetical protein
LRTDDTVDRAMIIAQLSQRPLDRRGMIVVGPEIVRVVIPGPGVTEHKMMTDEAVMIMTKPMPKMGRSVRDKTVRKAAVRATAVKAAPCVKAASSSVKAASSSVRAAAFSVGAASSVRAAASSVRAAASSTASQSNTRRDGQGRSYD